MDIHIRIDRGGIVIEQPRGNEVARHDDDARAVDQIAYQTVQKGRRVSYDISCREPGRHGRPGFSLPAFQAALRRAENDLRRSMQALAA